MITLHLDTSNTMNIIIVLEFTLLCEPEYCMLCMIKYLGRLLEGNRNLDQQLTREGAELLATRGVVCVEGGYKYTHDPSVKEV